MLKPTKNKEDTKMIDMITRPKHLTDSQIIMLLAACKCLPLDAHECAPVDFDGGRALKVDETHLICWLTAFEENGGKYNG